MRLTVGPLPPAVYWRRRAIVLAVAVVIVFLIVQSCSGGSGNGGEIDTAATQDPATTPTVTIKRPQTGAPPTTAAAKPSLVPTSAAAVPPSPTGAPVVPPPDKGTCTDAEVAVTPVPGAAKAPRGQTIVIRLRIKNISTRTCSRDVGASVQELYIKRGANTVWSSDTCAGAKGVDVQSFTPAFEREYSVSWNGRDTTRCNNAEAGGPVPAAGDYQVFARVGTKISAPVKLTLT
jgi:hypothetical protein